MSGRIVNDPHGRKLRLRTMHLQLQLAAIEIAGWMEHPELPIAVNGEMADRLVAINEVVANERKTHRSEPK